MKDLINKTILITGASSGIGAALARVASSRGAHLILVARRKERLEQLAKELSQVNQKVICLSVDLAVEGEIEKALAEALKEIPAIDVVIANAGFGVAGEFTKLSLEDYRRQFETNIFGVMRTIKTTLEALKKTRGCLGVVGSVNGYVALPGISAYAMSKFSIRALCDALFHEFRAFGVSVTHIAPGFVISEIRRVNNTGNFQEKAKDPIPLWLQMPADVAALKILNAVLARKRERVVTGHGFWIVRLYRFFPGFCGWLIKTFKIVARSEP